MTRTTLTRKCWAAFAVALLGAACGGDDGGDEAGEDPDGVLDAALLTEDEVDGLEAEAEEDWADPLAECDAGRELEDPTETRTVSFGAPSREGIRFRLAFQSVAAFPSEEDATAYADAVGEVLEDCIRNAEPRAGSFVVDDIEPLDLDEADIGDHAYGWSMSYEPDERIDPAVVSGGDFVVLQRGAVVSTVHRSVPIPDLDVVELGEEVYERLPD